MLKKLFLSIAVLFSFQVLANEDMQPIEKCESAYSSCLEKCDTSSNEENKEACYDKCDEVYSKCLDKIQSEE